MLNLLHKTSRDVKATLAVSSSVLLHIYIIDGPSWPQYATVEVGEKSVDLMLPVHLLKGLLDTLRLRARNEFPIDVSFAITNPYTTAT